MGRGQIVTDNRQVVPRRYVRLQRLLEHRFPLLKNSLHLYLRVKLALLQSIRAVELIYEDSRTFFTRPIYVRSFPSRSFHSFIYVNINANLFASASR
jgi:hypothetical protein